MSVNLAQFGMSSYNATEEQPINDYSPLPAGEYQVIITDSEMRETKAGTGSYLKVTLQVVDDANYTGRLMWLNLNLNNPNEKAVEIARRQFGAICRAVGVPTPEDSGELHHLPFVVKVKIEEREGWEPQNKVVNIRPVGDKPKATKAETSKPVWRQ